MIEIKQTDTFKKWLTKLKDNKAKGLIVSRVERLKYGHFGDFKNVGNDVCELRLYYGPGYRVYFTKHKEEIIILLCAGDKGTQNKDIELAKKLKQELEV